jgi:hypothetical protein
MEINCPFCARTGHMNIIKTDSNKKGNKEKDYS